MDNDEKMGNIPESNDPIQQNIELNTTNNSKIKILQEARKNLSKSAKFSATWFLCLIILIICFSVYATSQPTFNWNATSLNNLITPSNNGALIAGVIFTVVGVLMLISSIVTGSMAYMKLQEITSKVLNNDALNKIKSSTFIGIIFSWSGFGTILIWSADSNLLTLINKMKKSEFI